MWATAQYLSYAKPPSVMDVDVTLAAVGRSITQGRVVGHVGDTEILTVNAALGERKALRRKLRGDPTRDTIRVVGGWVRLSTSPASGICSADSRSTK